MIVFKTAVASGYSSFLNKRACTLYLILTKLPHSYSGMHAYLFFWIFKGFLSNNFLAKIGLFSYNFSLFDSLHWGEKISFYTLRVNK